MDAWFLIIGGVHLVLGGLITYLVMDLRQHFKNRK